MADYESSSNYKQARAIGRRFLSDHADSDTNGYLYILDDLLKGIEIAGEINLGTTEIPISKIVGTRTNARSNAFAGNFMPLLPENTEFGIKWMKLYNSHIKEGIRDPIKVYEYINQYFVQEGNKRVSVLKYLGAVGIDAKVTRLIPKRNEANKNISIYYEFLDFDKKAIFDNLWFSYRGSFTNLVSIVEHWKAIHSDNTEDITDLINSTFKTFRLCYRECGFSSIPITTGDAFLEYIKIYGFNPNCIRSDIIDQVKSCEATFKLISVKDPNTVNTIDRQKSDHIPLSFFSKRPTKLKIAFAYESEPNKLLWTYLHDIARRRLEVAQGDRLEIITKYNVQQGPAAYEGLKELIDQNPDILFATSPNMSDGALRLSLENPEKAILNCDIAQPKKNIMTYYAKLHEAAFLCGVMAGSMSKRGLIGFTSSFASHPGITGDLNAYAIGARLVNPLVHVININLLRTDGEDEYHITARKKLAEHGVDIALCLHQPHTPLVRKGFPGVYAQLYLLQASGHPEECIGAAALDWSVFYNEMVGDIFNSKNSIMAINRSGTDSSVHFGWGINTGMLDVLGVDSFMGHNSIRLLRIFKELIATGKIHPFEGPLFDNTGNLQLEKFETLSLLEIQNMRWMHEAVIDSIDMY